MTAPRGDGERAIDSNENKAMVFDFDSAGVKESETG